MGRVALAGLGVWLGFHALSFAFASPVAAQSCGGLLEPPCPATTTTSAPPNPCAWEWGGQPEVNPMACDVAVPVEGNVAVTGSVGIEGQPIRIQGGGGGAGDEAITARVTNASASDEAAVVVVGFLSLVTGVQVGRIVFRPVRERIKP